jgi:septum formation protein
MPVPFVLASASPARLATLRSAGIEPRVIASLVDEDAVLEAARSADPALSAAGAALALARAKAEEVASVHSPGALVLGCDSILELDGEWLGKPGDAATARDRWRAMRGGEGVLHTGHWLVDARVPDAGVEVGKTASTTVWFAELTDAEIDGLGGPFVERIDGDHHTVTGLSLPLLRHLCASIGVGIPELWARP